jgi:hypothetical protein
MSCDCFVGAIKAEMAYGLIEADSSHGGEAAQRAWALANVSYGSWELLTIPGGYYNALQVAEATIANTDRFDPPAYNVYFASFGTFTAVQKVKLRFSLHPPNLPVRVVYDIVKTTGAGAQETQLADQEFTLDDANSEQVVEVLLVESTDPDQVYTWLGNLRLFFCPYHV